MAGIVVALLGGFLVTTLAPNQDLANLAAPASVQPSVAAEEEVIAASPEAAQAATDQPLEWFVGPFERGADPVGFTRGPNDTLAYIDREYRSGSAQVIDYGARAVGGLTKGNGPSGGMGDPRLLAEVGEDLLVVDHRDRVFRVREAGGGDVGTFREDIADGADLEEDISAITSEALPGGRYRLYAVDPVREQILRYDPTPEERGYGKAFTYAEDIGQEGDPVALHVDRDGDLFALTADGVRVYRSGLPDDDYSLATPPGGAPEYRSFTGVDSAGFAQLFLYDAAGERILVFDKASGELVDEWTEDAEGRPLTDVRGLAAVEQIDGSQQLYWGTPRGLFAREILGPGGRRQLRCNPLTAADVDSQLQATLDATVGESVTDVDAVLADLGYCYEYREATASSVIEGLDEVFGRGNRWCATPPAGKIVTWKDSLSPAPQVGRLQLWVLAPEPATEPSRLAALGCAREWPQQVVWDSGSVRFEADSLRIIAGDVVFTGAGLPIVQGQASRPNERQLEVEWFEHGVEQRFLLELEADDEAWWATALWTYDGAEEGDWIFFDGAELTNTLRAPRGSTFEGDLELKRTGLGGGGLLDEPGSLIIEGLRLTAFAPGTGPAERTGCTLPTESPPESRFKGKSPKQAERILKRMGVCYEFRYEYANFAERWCKAPPKGRFSDVFLPFDESDKPVAYLIVTYYDDDRRGTRRQPPGGWKCPTK